MRVLTATLFCCAPFVTQSFDRDEPAREKIAYVTVKATDRGTPPLEAICTFNVTIEDINDNAPMVMALLGNSSRFLISHS